MQSGIGPGPERACVYSCVRWGWKKKPILEMNKVWHQWGPQAGPSVHFLSALCPLRENWFISPLQADPSTAAFLTIVSWLSANCSVCQKSGWTADESKNILSGNFERKLSSHNWRASCNLLVQAAREEYSYSQCEISSTHLFQIF